MDKLNKEIVRLSVPAIVSNVTVPLLGLCDTAISGHLGSELFLASIAVGTVMLNVVFWMFGFLRGGTTGLTAIAYGAENRRDIGSVFYRALLVAFSGGALLIIFRQPLFSFLVYVVGSGEDINVYVESYFKTRIWGGPALLGTMAVSGWFVGMQTTFYPMLIAIVMNVVNIITSFFLVFVFNCGFDGVATGTLISNWVGLLVSLVCVAIYMRGKPMKFIPGDVFKGGLWKYFSVNGNLFLRSFFIICVTMGVTAAGARLGNLTLAVNVIIMQFFQFFSFFMDGFAFSGEALVGRRFGENNPEMLNKTVKRLLLWTLAAGVIFSGLYLIFHIPVTSLLTDSKEVIAGVGTMWYWITLIPIVSCWAFIYDGFYVGITATGKMMISTLIASLVFFAVTFVSWDEGYPGIGVSDNNLIWSGFLSYLFVRGLYLSFQWNKTKQVHRMETGLR